MNGISHYNIARSLLLLALLSRMVQEYFYFIVGSIILLLYITFLVHLSAAYTFYVVVHLQPISKFIINTNDTRFKYTRQFNFAHLCIDEYEVEALVNVNI